MSESKPRLSDSAGEPSILKREFIWLHLTKCGGNSMKSALSPHYVQTNRRDPLPFIALPKSHWNDTLNNYRIHLGAYDFKRMLFAQKFLYSTEEFEQRFKFVVVRNPYDRLVSAWKYLMVGARARTPRGLLMKWSFERFLSEIPSFWQSKGLRDLATHTAPIWDDITDEEGNLLVDFIGKLERIEEDFAIIRDELGLHDKKFPRRNVNREEHSYRKHYNTKTRNLVERLYADDIENLRYEF